VPTIKYWNTLGPVSPPLFLYAANDGILVESGVLLKGLSNDDAEALRDCTAVQPARATGRECAVHERAIARVLVARAGMVRADGAWCGRGVGVVWWLRILEGAGLAGLPADEVWPMGGWVSKRLGGTGDWRHCFVRIDTRTPASTHLTISSIW
jgi:hypothetical protein